MWTPTTVILVALAIIAGLSVAVIGLMSEYFRKKRESTYKTFQTFSTALQNTISSVQKLAKTEELTTNKEG